MKQLIRMALVLTLAVAGLSPAFAATAPIAATAEAPAPQVGTPQPVELQANACKVTPPRKDCICPLYYDPVCGCDGQTYSNACFAQCEVTTWTEGACGSAS